MLCPRCLTGRGRTLESRSAEADTATRRRHACQNCAFRWTTYERLSGASFAALARLWASDKTTRRARSS
jgi:transcriptional repressor NrdR